MKMTAFTLVLLLGAGQSFAVNTEKIEDMRGKQFVLPGAAAEIAAAQSESGMPIATMEARPAPVLALDSIANNQSIAVNQAVLMEGNASATIAKIEFQFNGEPIGDAIANGGKFAFSHVFTKASDTGKLEVSGFDASGLKVAGASYYVNVIEASQFEGRYFNSYVLKAVDWLYLKYKLLGYDIHAALTHDIPYYNEGNIAALRPPRTMCVAAQLEVLLAVYKLYAEETGDYSVYDYLPKRSYEGLTVNDIRGHIWVNKDFNSAGTADALINFGMGERTTFEKLKPGSFININRDNGTGHAVTFLNFIDIKGKIQPKYNSKVAGFKYFSSQGKSAAGQGGFDYRYAIFSKFGCPELPYMRDCGVIYSTNQQMLTTGTMISPKYWKRLPADAFPGASGAPLKDTVLDENYFNGVTTDD
jgi:hypothetical protein